MKTLRFCRNMDSIVAAVLLIVAFSAGRIGYWLGATRSAEDTTMPIGRIAGEEAFEFSDSFSEVDSVRAQIYGLALRSLAEFRVRNIGMLTNAGPASPDRQRKVILAVRELRATVAEFRDTDGEPLVLGELLRVLKREGLRDAWFHWYLDYLRRHPTAVLVARLASEAASVADAIGRGAELREALDRVSRLPNPAMAGPGTLAAGTGRGRTAFSTKGLPLE